MLRVLHIVGVSFAVALTGAVSPGPMLALVISQVMAWGFWSVWPILAGHALVELVFIMVLLGRLAQLLARPRVRGSLAIAGGLVLAFMAWSMLRDASEMTLDLAGAEGLSWGALVLAGAGVSLANPYFTGWWATVGSGQFAALRLNRRRDLWAFFCGHELGDCIWYVFVALVLVGGKAWLTDAIYRNLILGCGVIVGLLAALFVFMGGRAWIFAPADKPISAAKPL